MPIACAAPSSLAALPGPLAPTLPNMTPRLTPIVIAVVCAHALALWALQGGLKRAAPAAEAPMIMVASLIEPAPPVAVPEPQPAPPQPVPPPPVAPPVPRPAPPQPSSAPAPEPAPQPAPRAQVSPTPSAPTAPATLAVDPGDAEPQTPTAPMVSATPALATAQAVQASRPAPIELPDRSAKHLNNPPPPYPGVSRRMGESGRVLIYARIEANGTASEAQIKTSSGYDRLDQAALKAVLGWRFVPGKRAGVPEAMWYEIPLDFVLD